MNTLDLSGLVAVVTGGSRGLGRAISEELAAAGADLVVNYNRTHPVELLESPALAGRRVVAVQADVAVVADCERLIEEAVKTFGRIDILVNNAGITRDGLLMRMDESAWDDVMDTNLKSVFATCRAACRPMMKARSGSIVNISSVSGIMGNAGQSNYAASKAGMIGFSKSLARELAPRCVRVNVVAPGFIASDMTADLPEKVREAVKAQVPLGAFGEPSDIAHAVAYLAGPRAKYVTGATLVVDGGMAM